MRFHKFVCESGCGEVFYTQSKRKNGKPSCPKCQERTSVVYLGEYIVQEEKVGPLTKLLWKQQS